MGFAAVTCARAQRASFDYSLGPPRGLMRCADSFMDRPQSIVGVSLNLFVFSASCTASSACLKAYPASIEPALAPPHLLRDPIRSRRGLSVIEQSHATNSSTQRVREPVLLKLFSSICSP